MNPPQGFMPYPIMAFPPPPQREDSIPPARVRVAVEFLNNLSFKTMPRVAMNDVNIETIDGQKLSLREQEAQSAACNLLISYFKGELPQDVFEKQEVLGKGTIINCLACNPSRPPSPSCRICQGTGSLIVFPSNACPTPEASREG